MSGKKGNIIAELRKEAGYTQKTLAEALHITDKAVSNWERGISRPDSALLHRLSLLLNADLELLLATAEHNRVWEGLIDLRQYNVDLSQRVLTQPLVYFLLSHFLLLDIRKIHVLTGKENQNYLSEKLYRDLGFAFDFVFPAETNLIIMDAPVFLFGSDLTRIFQLSMPTDEPILFTPANHLPVMLFCPAEYTQLYLNNREKLDKTATNRTLGRGMVCIDMTDENGILDVANFIRIYQKNGGGLIGSLEEISYRKGIISKDKLIEISPAGTYGDYLRAMVKE